MEIWNLQSKARNKYRLYFVFWYWFIRSVSNYALTTSSLTKSLHHFSSYDSETAVLSYWTVSDPSSKRYCPESPSALYSITRFNTLHILVHAVLRHCLPTLATEESRLIPLYCTVSLSGSFIWLHSMWLEIMQARLAILHTRHTANLYINWKRGSNGFPVLFTVEWSTSSTMLGI